MLIRFPVHMIAVAVAALLSACVQTGHTEPQAEPPTAAMSGAFFAISVADAEQSRNWYVETLGFVVVADWRTSEPVTRGLVLRRGNNIVEIVQRNSDGAQRADDPSNHGIYKAGFWVEDLAAFEHDLRARNVVFQQQTFRPRGAGYGSFAVRDKEGNYLQFFGP